MGRNSQRRKLLDLGDVTAVVGRAQHDFVHAQPRRQFLKAGLAAGGAALCARYAFAAPAATDARFVFIIQRGALDGLSAVPPIFERNDFRLTFLIPSRILCNSVTTSPWITPWAYVTTS